MSGQAGLKPDSLIETALELAQSNRRRPRQSNLRRAVSTAYYAVFHCLAACCADCLVGGPSAQRSERAWRQTYRALNHGPVKGQCDIVVGRDFPRSIESFAAAFSKLQIKRHKADYDPDWIPLKSSVLEDIRSAKRAIGRFREAPLKDRRAFAVWVLLQVRKK